MLTNSNIKLTLTIFVVTLLSIGLVQVEEATIIEDVIVLVERDPLTNETIATLGLIEKGSNPSLFKDSDKFLAFICTNGFFFALTFRSGIYLNDQGLGELTYTVNSGEAKTLYVNQKDELATVLDPFAAYDMAFSGTNLTIQVTAYNGDTDTGVFDTTYLGTAMNHVGCEFE